MDFINLHRIEYHSKVFRFKSPRGFSYTTIHFMAATIVRIHYKHSRVVREAHNIVLSLSNSSYPVGSKRHRVNCLKTFLTLDFWRNIYFTCQPILASVVDPIVYPPSLGLSYYMYSWYSVYNYIYISPYPFPAVVSLTAHSS
jgi:hypothetical protein